MTPPDAESPHEPRTGGPSGHEASAVCASFLVIWLV